MSDRAALLAEAHRRGILPPDARSAYEEAQRRGLLGGAAPEAAGPDEPAATYDAIPERPPLDPPGRPFSLSNFQTPPVGTTTGAALANREAWRARVEPPAEPLPEGRMSRPRSAANAVVQGVTGPLAGLPRGVDIARAQRTQDDLFAFDAIDRGEAPKAGIGGLSAQAERYLRADPAGRAALRESATQRSDPRNLSLYKAGDAAEKAVNDAFPTDPAYKDEFLADKLPRGVGSTAGYLAGGIAGRLMRAPALGTAAGLGAASQASTQFKDALSKGASLETAFRAANLGAAIGTAEGWPIAQLLDRFDKTTGGGLRKVLVEGLKGATEEGLQEVFQSVASNLVASGIVKYDPERGIFQGTGESAAVGFTVGGLFSTIAAMAGQRRSASAQSAGPTPERLEPTLVPPASEPAAEPAQAPPVAAAPTPAPEAAASPAPAAAPARPDFVVTPRGERYDVAYEVVEADKLRTSHTDDLSANPGYPAALQPRDRSRAASAEQVASISQNIVPELLGPSASAADGAPIVGPDDVVESGNARTIALRRAYSQNLPGAEQYRAYLEAQGFDVSGFRQPVLVRRRTTPLDGPGRASFAAQANERTTASMSASEQAQADAKAMPDWLMDTYRGGDLGLAANRDFVRRFLETSVSPSDRGRVATATGELSQEGLARIENAIFARAYEDARLLAAVREDPDANFKAIGNAMTDAAPGWAQMRAKAAQGSIPAGLDITPALREAVGLVRRARSEGKHVNDLVRQQDAFNRMSAEGEAVLQIMFSDAEFRRPASRQKVADALKFYAAEAQKAKAGETLLGGMPEVTPLDILRLAKRGPQGGMFDFGEAAEARAPSDGLAQRLREFVGEVVADAASRVRRKPRWMALEPVSPQLAADMARAIEARGATPPPDLASYTHMIDEDAVLKTLKDHGGRAELQRGNVPVTPDDFELLPSLIEQAQVVSTRLTSRGLQGVLMTARVGNVYYFVEEVRTGRKALAFLTMYKRPGGSVQSGQPNPPEQSPEASPGSPADPEGSAGNIGSLHDDDNVLAAAAPGGKYLGPRQDAAPTGAREIKDPKRRDAILKELAADLGVPFYQRRIKKRSRMLGFYRPRNEEIRLRNMNDAETAIHEAAHLLDYRFPEIRQQWKPATKANAAVRAELASVSYDASKIYEGFAEFVRLWATQPQEAQARVPTFSTWWEQHLDRSPHGPAVRRFKQEILAWFDQDALLRAASKVGAMENIGEVTRGLSAKLRQSVFDDLDGIMKMEMKLSGALMPVGPYETARLTRAKDSIVEGALLYGAPKVNRDGSHTFVGKGLRDILKPVSNDLDRFWLYAVGVSAQELQGQGRENLFTRNEIAAMKGLETPAFKQAFADYQDWNRAIVDFAVAKGAIDPEKRKLWKRTMYLPFYRVGAAGGEARSKGVEGDWKGIKALTGGTSNIRDVMGNVLKNASMLIDAAITNEARMEVARLAHKTKGGAEFLTRIPTEERKVLIPKDQIERVMLDALGVRSMRQLSVDQQIFFDQIAQNIGGMVALFQRDQAPGGRNVFAALDGGKPVYFEVADPILFRSIMALNRPMMHPAVQVLSWFRRIGQRSVTLTVDFVLKNLVRDTLMSGIMSRHGFVPIIDSARGFVGRLRADQDYKDFIANGGGVSSVYMQDGALKRRLERFYGRKGINWRTVIDTPAKLFDAVDTIADSFEIAARLGEFKRAKAAGASPRHAAYSGREVSTDFAMRGDDAFIGAMYDSIIFLKAAMNSWDRLYRGVTQDPNRARIAMLTVSVAMVSMGLAALNYGNPLLDDTEDWDRDTSWHFFIPNREWFAYYARTGQRFPETVEEAKKLFVHLRLPRIWEIGAVAAIGERTLERMLKGQPKELAKDVARIIGNTFHVSLMPQMIGPLQEVATNEQSFTGRPIVSKSVERLEPWAQSGPYGSQTLRRVGEAVRDVPGLKDFYSPAKAEALLRGYFNTWALYALNAADWTLFEDTPDARLDQYWVLRSFYREHPTNAAKELEELYDAIGEATTARATARFMAKTYRPGIAEEIAEKPETAEARMMGRADRVLQELGAQLRGAMYVKDLAEAQAMVEGRSEPGRNLMSGLKQRGKWNDLGALKRVLIDDLVQERNAFARQLMRDVKGRREERKAERKTAQLD